VGDYLDDEGLLDGEDEDRRRRFRRGQRQVPRIETLLQEGQEIIVQVAKEPIGTKGARITSHPLDRGRHLVLTPWSKRVGVSRRIGSDRERRRCATS
jgi:ribonuclease G